MRSQMETLKQQVDNLRYFIRNGNPVAGDYAKLASLLDEGDKLDKEIKITHYKLKAEQTEQEKPVKRFVSLDMSGAIDSRRENQNYDAEYYWRYNH